MDQLLWCMHMFVQTPPYFSTGGLVRGTGICNKSAKTLFVSEHGAYNLKAEERGLFKDTDMGSTRV